MRLLEINWHPDVRQLRQFGLISFLALPLVGWMWGAGGGVLTALAGIGLSIAIVGFAAPRLIRPVFVGLMIVAMPIGLVVGELAMLVIYFGMLLPLGLFFRAVGRDALALKRDRGARSYWSPKQQPNDVSSYYRQF